MFDPARLRRYRNKPRVLVLSDISNEPDDAESLVRFLTYGNEFEIQGLVACTSCWMKSRVCPEDMETIVTAYGKVVANLNAHAHPENQYPTMEHLRSLIRSGPPVYGKKALEPNVPLSEGASLLIDRLSASEEPLWVLCWGGTNVLAQALQHMCQNFSSEEFSRLRSRLRVYAISDQDDTGLWIRVTWPDIFYICSIHGWNQYQAAAWTGISGDILTGSDGGPDITTVTREWLKSNIQIGPLGAVYPDYKFIMEGDTPTFLYLIQNGLGDPEHPCWGSWGGRYNAVDLSRAANHWSDAFDDVVGVDGKVHNSNKATIWRWRNAFQNDFAARMQWTLTSDPTKANHAPVVSVNGSEPGDAQPLILRIEAGEEVELDATGSYDPDGDDLTFSWFHYREVTAAATGLVDPQIPKIPITDISGNIPNSRVKITLPPPEKCAIDLLSGEPQVEGQAYHFILEVKDNGSPSLVSYKRVVVQVTNQNLRGRRTKTVHTVTDFLELE